MNGLKSNPQVSDGIQFDSTPGPHSPMPERKRTEAGKQMIHDDIRRRKDGWAAAQVTV
jgi:hypothetical protein